MVFFFVEIGGYDGEKHSNSLFFEHERGWDGFLVEAIRFTFQQMVRRDRKCAMVHACVSNTVKSMHFRVAGGLTSAIELESASHADRTRKDSEIYGRDYTLEGFGNIMETNCTSLNTILKLLNTSHIDYFSLDVEGAELAIVESIDFESLTVDVFSIEVAENAGQIDKFMKKRPRSSFSARS